MMPPGPPPYKVTYKQFFITDPRTGKQTMKIQMIPADQGPPNKNEIGDDDWYYDYNDEDWDSSHYNNDVLTSDENLLDEATDENE